ncbi:hypothetical protein SUGI_0208070 [Cryptomeria japonica]|nr:hypothetical protein SUGI_0208070 [Cryptomeria japonica]
MDDDPNKLPGARPISELRGERYEIELKPDAMNIISWRDLTNRARPAPQSDEPDIGGDRRDEVPSSPPVGESSKRKREKTCMEEIPKKRPKKRVSQMQIPSRANEAVDDDTDELEHTEVNKELGSTSTGVLGSDEWNVSTASASNVKDDEPEFTEMLEKAFVDLESAVAESSAQQADMSQAAGSSEEGDGKRKYLPPVVTQRLNELASLVIAKYGKVPDDIVDRLHSILGHIMRRRNLRQRLKTMVKKHDDALQKGSEAQQDTDVLQKTDAVQAREPLVLQESNEDEIDEP